MELTAQEVWTTIRDSVRERIPEHSFQTWIAGARCVAVSEGEVIVEAPSPFHAEWLEDKYGDFIVDAAAEVLGGEVNLIVRAASSIHDDPVPSVRVDSPSDAFPDRGLPTGAPSVAPVGASSAPSMAPGPPGNRKPPGLSLTDPGLFSRYTFDRFVVGGNNQLADAAGRAVADNPGQLYNPLFLYGGVGLGKTHLMHAIGHASLSVDPHRRVAYVSSEQFTNELIQAIRMGATDRFRARYREIDLLLVDDVHFLQGKESTQEEFFHTFNALYDAQGQIVVTSDRPPREMEGLEQRLVSRFEWGLVVDLRPPDYETRMAILRTKAEDEGLVLADEVIDYIALSCSSSVRELEGAVLKLLAVSSVWHEEITLRFSKRVLALRKLEQQDRAPIASPDRITRLVANGWRVRPEALASKSRSRNITEARHVAMYVVRELLGTPLQQIGEIYGGRDHSTVLYSIRKVESRMGEDDEFRGRVEDVLAELRGDDASPFHY
ncbi:MAG: chromosomal replication initiator protein DnaA [Longimicrobiales bacterium]